MALTNNQITAQNFKDFYEAIRPYLGGGGGGFTPIGTIIAVMGNDAPYNYLKCDGTIYNIDSYPELANYFTQQFGQANEFGGDGTTTFAVPDLRGEFLRGTGTNSHENQGSGADVGEHQDGTEHVDFGFDQNANSNIYVNSNKITIGNTLSSIKTDTQLRDATKTGGSWFTSGGTYTANGIYGYTSRPTNTSVLYCIAVKNIIINTLPEAESESV